MRALVLIAVSVAALRSGRVSAGEQAPLSIQERVRKSSSILVAKVERVLPPGTLIPTNKHNYEARCSTWERVMGPIGGGTITVRVPPLIARDGEEAGESALVEGRLYVLFLRSDYALIDPHNGAIEVAERYTLPDEMIEAPGEPVRLESVSMSHAILLEKIRAFTATWGPNADAVLSAARDGNLAKVRRLVRLDRALVRANSQGFTPLHWAASQNHPDIAKCLIEMGAETSAAAEDGRTPLLMTSETAMVELLLAHDADARASDTRGLTALHIAAFHGNTELIRLLLDKGLDIEAQCDDRGTPLHSAASRGYQDAVELLLNMGAVPNSRNGAGATPLQCAARPAHLAAAEVLTAAGADVNAADKMGRTPLHEAAAVREGGLPTVRFLVEHGAKVNARCQSEPVPRWRVTPLHVAACGGDVEIIEFLLAHGADVDAGKQAGRTPLLAAMQAGHWDAARLLIESKADVNVRLPDDGTALHIAAEKGQYELASLLLERGADVNAEAGCPPFRRLPPRKHTPLHFAARSGRADTVELLIANGAAVNARDTAGRTPLDLAVEAGQTQVAAILREHSARNGTKAQ